VVTQKKKKIKWYITSEETGLIPQPFRSYIDQMRPMAVVPALIFGFFTPLILGSSLATAFAFALTLGFMQAGAQTINLSSPYEALIDIENNKGYRPTPSGRIPPKQAQLSGFHISS
jgi:UbiA prenyltransferase family.